MSDDPLCPLCGLTRAEATAIDDELVAEGLRDPPEQESSCDHRYPLSDINGVDRVEGKCLICGEVNPDWAAWLQWPVTPRPSTREPADPSEDDPPWHPSFENYPGQTWKVLLRRIVKYAREDRAQTPGFTRLARALAEAERLLSATPRTSTRDDLGEVIAALTLARIESTAPDCDAYIAKALRILNRMAAMKEQA